MRVKTKQMCLLLAVISVIVVGGFAAWRFQFAAATEDQQFGDYGPFLFAPLAAVVGGGLGLLTAGVAALTLSFVGSSDTSRSKLMTFITMLVLFISGLCTLVGMLVLFTPLGIEYGVMISRIRVWQADSHIAKILKLPDEQAVAALQNLIRVGGTSTKVRAANELCKFGDKADVALDDMLDLVFGRYGTLNGGEHFGNYPQFLIDRGPRAARLVPRLTEVLSMPPGIEEQEWLRLGLAKFSARMLGSIGKDAKSAASALEEVAMNFDLFEDTASTDDIDGTRTMAMRALKLIGVECEVFERLQGSRYYSTRHEAFLELERQCPEKLISRIADLLVDPSPQVRLRALDFSIKHGPTDVKEELIKATSDDDGWVRMAALNRLTQHFPESVTVDMVANNLKWLISESYGSRSSREMERILDAILSLDRNSAIEVANRLSSSRFEPYQKLAQSFLSRVKGGTE